MGYTQAAAMHPLSPDTLTRAVLLAVEVFDPVAQSLVSRGLTVKAKGLDGEPIVSWSGRFVWLVESGKWPQEISVVPNRLPFFEETVAPPRPPQFPKATPAERRVRITLRPTPAYNFPDGVTAIRGQLSEGAEEASPRVTDARVRLEWLSHAALSSVWLPEPQPGDQDPVTDARGEFAVFVRVVSPAGQSPDIEKGLLKVRLRFARGGTTRVTPEDYPFLLDPDSKGRVAEGQLLTRDLKLGWDDLPGI